MFSFYHWFLLLLFECFYFTNFLYCDCFLFVRYFIFVLLYRECYGFERAFFYSQAFFSSDSFHTFATVRQGLQIWVSPFYCQAFFYLTLIPHIYQSTASATYFKEPFLLSDVSYTPSPHLPQYRECFGYERAFFILRGFYLTLLPNKTPLRADNSPLKVAEPLTEVQNTDPAHVFVWITQCSVKGISW